MVNLYNLSNLDKLYKLTILVRRMSYFKNIASNAASSEVKTPDAAIAQEETEACISER